MIMNFLTEDVVRDNAKTVLGLDEKEPGVQQGTGQLTTFNQLGFKGISDKPDGWYIPSNRSDIAIILETKNSGEDITKPTIIKELKKNCKVLLDDGYQHVIGILHNGIATSMFLNNAKSIDVPDELQHKSYYIKLVLDKPIDKEKIYTLTAKINNCLHSEFGIKNLYHRMIFTACALVAKRYGAYMSEGMDYSAFKSSIESTIGTELYKEQTRNPKLKLLLEVFSEIKMNLNVSPDNPKEKEHVRKLIGQFIGWVTEISDCVNSDSWNGEDVMGIFFNEFNRYKKKSESGQVFTPDHITSFMYRLIEVTPNDYVGDFCCGSGAFLVKSMCNMIKSAGGNETAKASEIKSSHLFGIEYDREIFALACANMLIHKDGKTNLEQMDTRTDIACQWIKSKPITKVLMNPPYENKYGCIDIVKNVLDNVAPGVQCAFILPDKKLEKANKTTVNDIIKHHRITTIIKLPKDLFFGVGVETSIFVFTANVPQNDEEIFTYYIEDDGLLVVKNKGRHDVKNRWPAIEDKVLDDIKKRKNGEWIKPSEHLSYQVPEKPFEIYEEDFQKTALKYLLFKNGLGGLSELSDKVAEAVLFGAEVTENDDSVVIKVKKK